MPSRFYLIDASAYASRTWFSIAPAVRDARGEPANAVYGFGRCLAGLLARDRWLARSHCEAPLAGGMRELAWRGVARAAAAA